MSDSISKKQIQSASSKLFRRGKTGKDELASFAGASGSRSLSSAQTGEKLKSMGYNVKKRKAMIDQLKGGIGSKDMTTLTKKELGKLSWVDQQKAKKAIKMKQARNIKIGRASQEQQEQKSYLREKGGLSKEDKGAPGGLVGGPAKKGSFIGSKSSEGSGFIGTAGSAPTGIGGGPPASAPRSPLPF